MALTTMSETEMPDSTASEEPVESTEAADKIKDAMLRYHRKNPLRVAFATAKLLAAHDAQVIDEVYQQLMGEQKMEAVFHQVQRQGRYWPCYRITKEGMTDDGG